MRRSPVGRDAEDADAEVVRVDPVYPDEWHHLHGKPLSGLNHSHPLRDGEDPDCPDHGHSDAAELAIYGNPWLLNDGHPVHR